MSVGLTCNITRAAMSLLNMTSEMLRKHLELKRITKTAGLLLESGFKSPVLFGRVAKRCIEEQNEDGGWVAVVDTIWNVRFLALLDSVEYSVEIQRGVQYLEENRSRLGLWGRSKRDFDRIPVSGIALSRIPLLVSDEKLRRFEKLWISEINSLTYKAAYALMAFKAARYNPMRKNLIADTLDWLVRNQRDDGSFAPWKQHPVSSDTYCTAVAILGLLSYRELIDETVIDRGVMWLKNTQLESGIWPFHEIEDGTSWALLVLSTVNKN